MNWEKSYHSKMIIKQSIKMSVKQNIPIQQDKVLSGTG